VLKGISGSSGFGIGKVFCFHAFDPEIREEFVSPEQRQTQLLQFQAALERASSELTGLRDSLSEDKAAIFSAHLEMLEDEAIREEILEGLQGGASAQWAVYSVFQSYIELMQQQDNPLMRERAVDLKDVRNRVLRILRGEKERSLAALKSPAIVAAHDVLPSDVARMESRLVLAFLTETGGATSHAAILARSLSIPAVLGIPDLMHQLVDDQLVIVDGESGTVLIEPDEESVLRYRALQTSFAAKQAQDTACLPLESRTKSGERILLSLNIGSPELPETQQYADGVGLFRSEFLYMEQSAMPSEEAQFAAYTSVLRKMGDRPVILRTLDIGGDKTLPYLPLSREDNPFLGNRAIRLCFSHEDLFRTQLRAAYRAAGAGNLMLMFPMIGSIEDFRRAKEIARSVRDTLLLEGQNIPQVPLGIMIEIPSAALTADQLAREADFASLGTNDLCQYTFAADRMNPIAAAYAHPLSAAMLRLIRMSASAFLAAGKPISVCGELAGDARAIPLLLGCGITKLSMSASALPQAKRIVRSLTRKDCETLLEQATACETELQIRALCDAFLHARIG
jgi:phosphotransferase system enzyme I (PtsI)